ncbi:hypothetical protein MGN70_004795, partial [Eutypa lata]
MTSQIYDFSRFFLPTSTKSTGDHHRREPTTPETSPQQLSDALNNLCHEAPSIARSLAKTILECVGDIDEADAQNSGVDSKSSQSNNRKRPMDPTFRPPKSNTALKRSHILRSSDCHEEIGPEVSHQPKRLKAIPQDFTIGPEHDKDMSDAQELGQDIKSEDLAPQVISVDFSQEAERMDYQNLWPEAQQNTVSHAPSTPKTEKSKHGFLSNMITSIHTLNRREEIPAKTFSKILRALEPGASSNTPFSNPQPDTVWTSSDSDSWSGTMWVQLMEKCASREQVTMILNLIACMGFSLWFDKKIDEVARDVVHAKKRKPKLLVSNILTALQDEAETDMRLKLGSGGVAQEVTGSIRRRLIKFRFRGAKLRKMIGAAGLWILLSRKI